MRSTVDFAVIGAGVVGLAIARQLKLSDPDRSVVVFDKETALAVHASGRNSGVLHAGFYYSPDSLKARLTRRGNVLLHEFCDEHDVTVRRCGKVVVARADSELPAMQALVDRGAANGVPLEVVDEDGLRELEPLAVTTQRAIWSPMTSVADPVEAVRALAGDAERLGVEVRLGESVLDALPGYVKTANGEWSVGHIINCAGLYADHVARWFGMCDDYVIVPFKGVYRYGNWEPGRLQRHVYPVPDPRNPFLGVHTTVTVDGRVKIGPTAIPVLSRENYRRMSGIRVTEVPGTIGGLTRFLISSGPAARPLVTTEVRKYSVKALAADAAALVPSIRWQNFRTVGRPGIRAQLLKRSDGTLEMDFVVRGDRHSTHLLNAVSPAWTSALAVAEHVDSDIRSRLK